MNTNFFPKSCTCGRTVSEKEAVYLGTSYTVSRTVHWYNCPHCKSTFIETTLQEGPKYEIEKAKE